MTDIWVILAQLPLMLVLSFVVGYEPVVFMGIGLFGMVFWMYVEDPVIKRTAFFIFAISEILFIASMIFHIKAGIPAQDPFSLIFLMFLINYVTKFFK